MIEHLTEEQRAEMNAGLDEYFNEELQVSISTMEDVYEAIVQLGEILDKLGTTATASAAKFQKAREMLSTIEGDMYLLTDD